MSNSCHAFRAMLIDALSGRGGLTELGWHVHLHECLACRDVLEQEEALDAVLASLPEPQLPARLVERVLARLRANGAPELDGLLELDSPTEPPADLHKRVLAQLSGERAEQQLDRLLELDEVAIPAQLVANVARDVRAETRLDALLAGDRVAAPVGLGGRILERLESERSGARSGLRHVTRPAPFSRRSTWLRLAAGFLLVLGAWAVSKGRFGEPEQRGARLAQPIDGAVQGGATPASDIQASDMPAADLLAALDVLENWEALEAGQDVGLDAFNSIDAGDEVVLELLLELQASEEEGDNG